jgi:hypothetical protein
MTSLLRVLDVLFGKIGRWVWRMYGKGVVERTPKLIRVFIVKDRFVKDIAFQPTWMLNYTIVEI